MVSFFNFVILPLLAQNRDSKITKTKWVVEESNLRRVLGQGNSIAPLEN
jgi:hypothetical protein